MGVSESGATKPSASCCGRMMSRLMLMIAMVLALAAAAPGSAHADWDDRPDPAEFEDELAPHGYWVDDAQFGRVWRPNTWWAWRPYVDGHWIWTSYGWTWASDDPWGWTYHYGRWGFSNLYGWVWTPGYVWGPAWVDWYWGDGYVGWVPLGPPGFAIVPTYWTYVRDFSFCSPRITNVVVVQDRLPGFIVHHREQGWGRRHAPDFRDIEHVSRFRIEQAQDRPDRSIAPWVKHRMERGERVRERVADRGGERVIEHPGRGGDGHRGGEGRVDGRGGTDGRSGDDGRGRPRVSDDGWRRPNERADRTPHVIERDRRNDDANGPVVRGRADDDDHMGPRSDDDAQGRQRDQGARPPMSHGRDDAFRRSPPTPAGSGWVRQPPQRSEPFEAPRPQRSDPYPAPPPSRGADRPAPSMGHQAGGGGQVFVDRQPAPPRGAPAPQGDAGARGNPGAGGSTMQHGHAGGSPSTGRPGQPSGWDHNPAAR